MFNEKFTKVGNTDGGAKERKEDLKKEENFKICHVRLLQTINWPMNFNPNTGKAS